MSLKIDFTFDKGTYRHFMNGHPSVLHCHHYMALTSKLADDHPEIDGPRILRESAEDSIRPLLDDYYAKNGVTSPEERLKVGEEYYSIMGMGRMKVTGTTAGGQVVLDRSHVDEGWIKKWGKHDKPINHWTCGYLSALFGAAFGKPARSYKVQEKTSIVTGEPKGTMTVEAA